MRVFACDLVPNRLFLIWTDHIPGWSGNLVDLEWYTIGLSSPFFSSYPGAFVKLMATMLNESIELSSGNENYSNAFPNRVPLNSLTMVISASPRVSLVLFIIVVNLIMCFQGSFLSSYLEIFVILKPSCMGFFRMGGMYSVVLHTTTHVSVNGQTSSKLTLRESRVVVPKAWG